MYLLAPALPPGSSAFPTAVNISQFGGSSVSLGQKTMANSMPVVIASDQSTLSVNTKITPSATATLANVSGSASSVTLLATNANRLGATIVNDSTAQLYVKFGSASSTSSYVYTLFQWDTLEVPFGYTGIITGIWGSATGAARVTEYTA